MIRTASSRYSRGISEPSPYYQPVLGPFTLWFLWFGDTYESRCSEVSVFSLVRWLKCIVVYRIEKPRHNIVEEGWLSVLGVIPNCCDLLETSRDNSETQEPRDCRPYLPGNTCQTLKSPSSFSLDWFSHSHVAVGNRRISFSTFARAISVSSSSVIWCP
jgi:hypothetical protein